VTKKLVFALCLLLYFAPELLSAEVYSLNELYRVALERSEVIKVAEEDLYISERDKDSALADLIPTLSAFGYHTRYTDAKTSSGFLLQPDYTNEWGTKLGTTYSLGGREFTNLKIAQDGIDQSAFDLHSVREGYLLNVAVQYYAVLRAKREIEIAAANVQRLTKQRDVARKRLEVGESIKTDVLRAEAELADAQSELITSENTLKVANNVLAKTVGIREEYDVREPQPGIDYRDPDNGDITLDFLKGECTNPITECLKQLALSERSEIRSLMVQKDIAERSVASAKSSYWPDLSLEGIYSKQENEPSRSFELNEQVYGVLRLDFPFYEGGAKKAAVSKAHAKLRQTKYYLSDLKQQISKEVENTYIVATTAVAVLKTRQAAVKFAQENYNLVSKQFQYGLADSVDVIDANTRLITSEREIVNAEYVYQLALLTIKRVTGTLLKTVVSSQ
jgi:outer membrane protein